MASLITKIIGMIGERKVFEIPFKAPIPELVIIPPFPIPSLPAIPSLPELPAMPTIELPSFPGGGGEDRPGPSFKLPILALPIIPPFPIPSLPAIPSLPELPAMPTLDMPSFPGGGGEDRPGPSFKLPTLALPIIPPFPIPSLPAIPELPEVPAMPTFDLPSLAGDEPTITKEISAG